jgi:hypothetical protein
MDDESKKVVANDLNQMVVAKVPQSYDMNLNIRIIPARSLEFQYIKKECKSRTGISPHWKDPDELPPDLIDKFKEFDKVMVAWLAESETMLGVSSESTEALQKLELN